MCPSCKNKKIGFFTPMSEIVKLKAENGLTTPPKKQFDTYGDASKYQEELLAKKAEIERLRNLEREEAEKKRKQLHMTAYDKATGNYKKTRTNLGNMTGAYYCNTHTCELLQDSGFTIPQGAEPININGKIYKPGDQVPVIPGNMQMKGNLKSFGFIQVDPKDAQPGDFAHVEKFKDHDYQGNQFSPRWVPSHSMLYSGKHNGENYFFNAPGGDRMQYDNTPYKAHDDKTRLVYYRYQGATPYYDKQLADLDKEIEKYQQYSRPQIGELDTRQARSIDTATPTIAPIEQSLYPQRKEYIDNLDVNQRRKKSMLKALEAQQMNTARFTNEYQNKLNADNNLTQYKLGDEVDYNTYKELKKQGYIFE